ncbi:hypothetical protein NDU88_007596 [Pleurodeles waltl]|uniref:Uncharacterized protein n=1 Tax=Pleurodeles waltl TaxID=8319 RepID=A0AAV7SSU7_PLEWA|nr:hypothetical protein NDU88_007596 [Pleurodeles waltl]
MHMYGWVGPRVRHHFVKKVSGAQTDNIQSDSNPPPEVFSFISKTGEMSFQPGLSGNKAGSFVLPLLSCAYRCGNRQGDRRLHRK